MYVQSNTLLLSDVFENFRNLNLKIHELDPAPFLTAPVLTCQAASKKTNGTWHLLTDIDLLLMAEKGITGGICHSIHWSAKANNKYMKDYHKNKELSYFQYWDLNNLHGLAMSQKLPVKNFEWMEDTSQFNEDFIKNYEDKKYEESDEGYFLEVDVQYPEKLLELHNDLLFLPERIKTEEVEKLIANFHNKNEYLIQTINLKQTLNHGLVL